MNSTFAIVQARMHSSRLPGKVLKEIQGRPMIYHILDRIKLIRGVNEIIVATTDTQLDDAIEKSVSDYGVKCFRGDEYNVLKRYYDAATKFHTDNIIRLTCDNPLIDPQIISDLVDYYFKSGCKYTTMKKYPLGLGAEIFSYKSLKDAYNNASKDYEREHVTPYMYVGKDNINIMTSDVDYSDYRFTVDTKEDFDFVCAVYDKLYRDGKVFYLDDIINMLHDNPEIVKINSMIKQKKLGE